MIMADSNISHHTSPHPHASHIHKMHRCAYIHSPVHTYTHIPNTQRQAQPSSPYNHNHNQSAKTSIRSHPHPYTHTHTHPQPNLASSASSSFNFSAYFHSSLHTHCTIHTSWRQTDQPTGHQPTNDPHIILRMTQFGG